jgi:hypothetical protein
MINDLRQLVPFGVRVQDRRSTNAARVTSIRGYNATSNGSLTNQHCVDVPILTLSKYGVLGTC